MSMTDLESTIFVAEFVHILPLGHFNISYLLFREHAAHPDADPLLRLALKLNGSRPLPVSQSHTETDP